MNEFRMLADILQMYRQAERMKRQCQALYDELGGAVIYILEYAETNNIPLSNRKALFDMVNRLHYKINTVNVVSDESLHGDDPTDSGQHPSEPILNICDSYCSKKAYV